LRVWAAGAGQDYAGAHKGPPYHSPPPSPLREWDSPSRMESPGNTILTYNGHTRPVKAVAWSPDGRYIASGGDDATLQVWEAFTGKRVATYGEHTSWIRSLAWSPGGEYIAAASNDTVHVWRIWVA
jgi:WD40 repeat protein